MDRRRSIIDRESRSTGGFTGYLLISLRSRAPLRSARGRCRSAGPRGAIERRAPREPARHRHQRLRGRGRRLDDREHLCRRRRLANGLSLSTKLRPSALNDDVLFGRDGAYGVRWLPRGASKSARSRSCRLSDTSPATRSCSPDCGALLDGRGRSPRLGWRGPVHVDWTAFVDLLRNHRGVESSLADLRACVRFLADT